MKRLRVREAFHFDGEDRLVGEIIEATPQEAKMLVRIGRCAVVKPARKQRYRTRELRADRGQYETKQ